MTYFREVSDLLYQSQQPNRNSSFDHVRVKNFFRRAKIRDDFFSKVTAFTKYKIIGEERPEQVSEKIYGSPSFDWVVLISNNIINVRTEWPLSDSEFTDYLYRKYTETELSSVHHYETTVVTDGRGKLIVPGGLVVDSNFSTKYFDETIRIPGSSSTGSLKFSSTQTRFDSNIIRFNTTEQSTNIPGVNGAMVTVTPIREVTVYEYEVALNERKRNIFLLRNRYLQTAIDDMREIMSYGFSTQYVDDRTKKGEDLRILSYK
jgi:hypothetical protein